MKRCQSYGTLSKQKYLGVTKSILFDVIQPITINRLLFFIFFFILTSNLDESDYFISL